MTSKIGGTGSLTSLQRAKLNEAYQKGYRYVVRDKDSDKVVTFSLKPKKYQKDQFWGYRDEDIDKKKVLMADSLCSVKDGSVHFIDIEQVKWTDRQPTLIVDLLHE